MVDAASRAVNRPQCATFVQVSPRIPQPCGRYWMFDELARGGMASVHYGRLVGAHGFALTVAIKRLLPAVANDPKFVTMFANEARIASRIRHPNVVPTLDVIEDREGPSIVMEYVHGESLSQLVRAGIERHEEVPFPVSVRVACDVLQGLHAAHDAQSEDGRALEIIHRDVSPQNVLVGIDGIARVMDFGIAKAVDRGVVTREGEVKGKLRYIAPEQLTGSHVDRRADVYAVGVVVWELLTGRPLRKQQDVPAMVTAILHEPIAPPSRHRADVPPALEAVVMRALSSDPFDRFSYASDMAAALAEACSPAAHGSVATWVMSVAAHAIDERAEHIRSLRVAPVPTSELASSPRGSRSRWVAAGFALAALAVGTTLTIAATYRTRNSEPPGSPVTSASGIDPSNPVTLVRAFPSSSASATPISAASSTNVALVASSARSSGTLRAPAVHPLTRGAVKHRDCRVPYTVDADGVRVPRPECM